MTIVRPEQLLVRADPEGAIGSGHLMRCLALAQAWQDAGGDAVFAMAGNPGAIGSRLRAEGLEVLHVPSRAGSSEDARACARLAGQMDASWVVVDGCHFQRDYQRTIRDAGHRLLVIDDYGSADGYSADFILNQNLSAHAELYRRRDPDAQLLFGTRYALLRRAFAAWPDWRRSIPSVARRVLVTLGGSDPDNVTAEVIGVLDRVALPEHEIVVVVGSSNPHRAQLEAVARAVGAPVHLKHNVVDMPDWMAWADLAISAAGSTTWELCCLGLPAVLIVLADNQAPTAAALAEHGCMESIGRWERVQSTERLHRAVETLGNDVGRRAAMSTQARRLVDGQGAARVVDVMLATANQPAEVIT